ncbi:PadR family transcriptional regulator [Halobacterium salinarum]|uniref:PadR family transcriptional regulator n=2 Tax=Halobacteriaceae TaxID=2236 RepID=UPI00255293E8|nr:PadR family transcriptional regulator [Halobacterium salinarum]MDL0139218.1 PadR family transcriptional regulator [Halobacterium salinarum]
MPSAWSIGGKRLPRSQRGPDTASSNTRALPPSTMSKWLASGLRRDVCVVVAGEGSPTQQSVKRAVERKHDDRIDPQRFVGVIRKLESAGIIERERDGLHDRLLLTDAGQRRLRDHHAWVADYLDD